MIYKICSIIPVNSEKRYIDNLRFDYQKIVKLNLEPV